MTIYSWCPLFSYLAGHCLNPGIPIGGRKEGSQYRIEYRVSYTCDRGLILFGSSERICQESGSWSGSEPECRREQRGKNA